jgi:hypothetical protein
MERLSTSTVRTLVVSWLCALSLVASSLLGTTAGAANTFPRTRPVPPVAVGGDIDTSSCVTGPVCVALGWNHHGNSPYFWAARWRDGEWTRIAAPPLAIDGQGSPSISCASRTWCMATGSTGLNTGNHPIAEELIGAKWQSLKVPTPKGSTDFVLFKLDCRSTTWCIAVGNYVANKRNYVDATFLTSEVWHGMSWRMVPIFSPRTYAPQVDPGMTPGGEHPTASPQQLSCVSKSFCVFAGFWTGVFVEQWNGQRWSKVYAPNATPPIARSSEFAGGMCVSKTFCVAAGGYAVSNGAWRPLLEQWNGRSWRIVKLPELLGIYDHGTGLRLSQVQCASSKLCIAFGDSGFGDRGSNSLKWNGTTWSYISIANQSRASFGCLSKSDCFLFD